MITGGSVTRNRPLPDECGHTPHARGWPVCILQKDHPGDHQSADFYWNKRGLPTLKDPARGTA